ncbi:hypothetical protein H0H87_002119 [Tephrocybe sp. NHM501043]|nr:hypothetical protein H0H87_002119 [Tephrocybe sp. NHM501043]
MKRMVQTVDLGPHSPETPKSRRHGAPAGPWPWKDFSDLQPERQPAVIAESPGLVSPGEWRKYPQSLFPNWTPSQVKRSKIEEAIQYSPENCVIRFIDISNNSDFTPGETIVRRKHEDDLWKQIQKPRPQGVTIRVFFLNKPSGPVLQILGTK